MIRLILISLTFFGSCKNVSQNQGFDSAVRRLYFGVDIFNATASVVDTFRNVTLLRYTDTVVNQWSLGASIGQERKQVASSSRHVFSFTRSPIPGLDIQSGDIIVILGETTDTAKLIGVQWHVDFDKKDDADLFYKTMQEIFGPLSTKHKTAYDKFIGQVAHYSTRNENEKGVRDISFVLGKSPITNRYQIRLSLFNDFAAKEEKHTKRSLE